MLSRSAACPMGGPSRWAQPASGLGPPTGSARLHCAHKPSASEQLIETPVRRVEESVDVSGEREDVLAELPERDDSPGVAKITWGCRESHAALIRSSDACCASAMPSPSWPRRAASARSASPARARPRPGPTAPMARRPPVHLGLARIAEPQFESRRERVAQRGADVDPTVGRDNHADAGAAPGDIEHCHIDAVELRPGRTPVVVVQSNTRHRR
jgi:hypothetical protein